MNSTVKYLTDLFFVSLHIAIRHVWYQSWKVPLTCNARNHCSHTINIGECQVMISKQSRLFGSSERRTFHCPSPALPGYKSLVSYSVNIGSCILDKYLLALLWVIFSIMQIGCIIWAKSYGLFLILFCMKSC